MVVNLLGEEINLEIYKKKSLRRVHFKYQDGCLIITAPYFYSKDRIFKIIDENKVRLLRYYNETKKRQLRDNSEIKILGKSYTLKFANFNKLDDKNIYIKEPYNDNMAFILFKMIQQYLVDRTHYFYNLIYKDSNCPSINFKNVKTYRGQYNKRDHLITYNVSLGLCSLDSIDYVIVHELAHIKEMNHQEKFYKIIETYLPNYKELNKKLKKEWINLC